MTPHEHAYITRLASCRFAPATFDKRFARDMSERPADYPLSVKQAKSLWRLVHRYRRQLQLTRQEEEMAKQYSEDPPGSWFTGTAGSPCPCATPAIDPAAAAPFIAAILADPDNDQPRLVYADWLEEQGDPDGRGEFIRVQVELAKMRVEPDADEFFRAAGQECWQCRCSRLGQQHTNGRCLCSDKYRTLRRREQELLNAGHNH